MTIQLCKENVFHLEMYIGQSYIFTDLKCDIVYSFISACLSLCFLFVIAYFCNWLFVTSSVCPFVCMSFSLFANLSVSFFTIFIHYFAPRISLSLNKIKYFFLQNTVRKAFTEETTPGRGKFNQWEKSTIFQHFRCEILPPFFPGKFLRFSITYF